MSEAQALHDELTRLGVRLDHAETEIKLLREARHDHAGKITTLLLAVEVIKKQLEDLRSVPGEIEQIKQRVAELEAGVRGVREEIASVLKKLGAMEQLMNAQAPRLLAIEEKLDTQGKKSDDLERRLATKDVIALIVIQVVAYLVQRYLL